MRAAYDLYLDQLEEFGSLWETWVGIQEDVGAPPEIANVMPLLSSRIFKHRMLT